MDLFGFRVKLPSITTSLKTQKPADFYTNITKTFMLLVPLILLKCPYKQIEKAFEVKIRTA